MSTSPMPLLLTEPDAAKLLAISPRALWTLADNGEVKSITVGTSSKRYALKDLEAYVDRLRAEADRGKITGD